MPTINAVLEGILEIHRVSFGRVEEVDFGMVEADDGVPH